MGGRYTEHLGAGLTADPIVSMEHINFRNMGFGTEKEMERVK